MNIGDKMYYATIGGINEYIVQGFEKNEKTEEECVVLAWASDLSLRTAIDVRTVSAIGITSDYNKAKEQFKNAKEIWGGVKNAKFS